MPRIVFDSAAVRPVKTPPVWLSMMLTIFFLRASIILDLTELTLRGMPTLFRIDLAEMPLRGFLMAKPL